MQDAHHEDAERLHSGAPFWIVKNGTRDDGEPLDGVVDCDVAVIGAGITGALVADALTATGVEVVVLDRNEPGAGSTGASTALLLYELDAELIALAGHMGIEDAAEVYQLCLGAVHSLEKTALALGGCGFTRKASLYLASRGSSTGRLEREAALRQTHGLPATYLDRAQLESRYGIRGHGAILSSVAAEVDPVRLTTALLHRAMRRGLRLFTHTTALGVDVTASGVTVHASRGGRVRARRVVYAMGYELPPSLEPNLTSLHSTYALATQRIDHMPDWLESTVLWETARPYAYLRTSGDGRLMIGGEDLPFKNAALRDRLLPSRIARLERRLEKLVPGVRTRTAFAWAGTFGETPDCLPYIGAHPNYPGAWFALGYGGNGITFSVLAARLISDALHGRPNAAARLFSPTRDVRRRSATPPCGAPGVAGALTRSIGALP